MLRVIGIGDNVIDRYFHMGMMFPGGNSLNFAVYAKQLEHDAAYLGVLGDDSYADIITSALEALCVDYSLCVRAHGETGLCSTKLIGGERVISEDNDGGVVKSQPLKLTGGLIEYIKTFDVAHSGCLGYIDDELYKIKRAGVPLVYDFSDIWQEKDFERVCPYIDIAFFSGKKLPHPELEEMLKATISYGCRLSVCTIGKGGAIVYDGRRFFEKAPYNLGAKVVDTLGAGDSFITGFVTAYFEGAKAFEHITESEPERYCAPADIDDYMDSLIGYAMSAGNLLAIKSCMAPGAFGHGVPLR